MATHVQRGVSIANAFINGVATAEQTNKMLRALANYDGAIAQYDDPLATNNEKARLGLAGFRTLLLPLFRALDKYDREREIGAIPDPAGEYPEQP